MVIPYVSGFELLRVIRRHPDWKTIPVIMLSADHYEPDIQQALREGATTYLVKQPGLHNLIQAIAQVLPPPVPAAPVLDQAVTKPATPAARENGRPHDRFMKTALARRASSRWTIHTSSLCISHFSNSTAND
jgi:DNA-binding response OmpR family regulator